VTSSHDVTVLLDMACSYNEMRRLIKSMAFDDIASLCGSSPWPSINAIIILRIARGARAADNLD